MLTVSQMVIAALHREDIGYVHPYCAAQITNAIDVERSIDGIGSFDPVIRYTVDELEASEAEHTIEYLSEDRELSQDEIDDIYDNAVYPCDYCGEAL